MAIHTDIEQGSPEWLALRAGKITASRLADILAKGRGGAPSATRANYLAELVAERMTGQPYERYRSPEMQWGTDHEAEARLMYELTTGCTVTQVAFVDHPTIANAGASPDGLVRPDGAIEIKCPNTSTHIETMRTGTIKKQYRDQCQWVLECTGRAWADFISYDPRMPEGLQLYIQRVERDDEYLAEARAAVSTADAEIESMVRELLERAQRDAQPSSADGIF